MRFSSCSLRRTGLSLGMLGMLAIVSPRLAANDIAFEATLEFTITFVHGHELEAEFTGTATPWGPFTGTASEFAMGFRKSIGTLTMEFGGGTLVLAYESVTVTDGVLGSWFVLEGTGIFAEAMGSGDFFIVPIGPLDGISNIAGAIRL